MQHSGEMVKATLRAKGMTQVELAKRIGRDQTLISRYVSGQIEVSDETGLATRVEPVRAGGLLTPHIPEV